MLTIPKRDQRLNQNVKLLTNNGGHSFSVNGNACLCYPKNPLLWWPEDCFTKRIFRVLHYVQ